MLVSHNNRDNQWYSKLLAKVMATKVLRHRKETKNEITKEKCAVINRKWNAGDSDDNGRKITIKIFLNHLLQNLCLQLLWTPDHNPVANQRSRMQRRNPAGTRHQGLWLSRNNRVTKAREALELSSHKPLKLISAGGQSTEAVLGLTFVAAEKGSQGHQ